MTRENEKLNLNELESSVLAQRLFGLFKEYGAEIPEENQAQLLDILTTSQMLHYDRRELASLLGLNKAEAQQLKTNIATDRRFSTLFNELLKRQLVSPETRQSFSEGEIDIVNQEQVVVGDKVMTLEGISDSDLAGQTDLRQLALDIIDDDNTAAQGMFWNVIIPKNKDYVLKIQRENNDNQEVEFARNSLFQYPLLKEELGDGVLPKQAVIKIEGEHLAVVQEKVDIENMISIRAASVDSIISGEYGPEIKTALEDEGNKRKLREFIEGVERIFTQHRLMVDLVGDNLFFGVSDDGELIIKLPDYGCTEHKE